MDHSVCTYIRVTSSSAMLTSGAILPPSARCGSSAIRICVSSRASGTFWSPCGRRNEVVGGLRRLLVTSRTSSWVVPPPKVVFYRDASSAYARKGCIARAPRVLSDRPSAETSTGFGGGFCATGCFGRGWAQGGQGARGLPRRRRLGAQGGRPSESA